jgi:hypothetical protein
MPSLRARTARRLRSAASAAVFSLANWMHAPTTAAAVSSKVDDSRGWHRIGGAPNDRDAADIQLQYENALEAWRKQPMAKRIIDITTDYCLGDGLPPKASGVMGTFLDRWWNHPKNHMPLRLADLSDELARAGDLFVSLHRNPDNGLSYVRPIPKDRIVHIETLPNDWETELAFYETMDVGEPRRWLSPDHPSAPEADAVMVHYSVNRVVGAIMGESDLGTIIPWLQRYSRMLEDRVRLNWAARAFLWIVTVPTNLVQAKVEQYRKPPDAGSVIVKDESEKWEPVNPNLHAFDAQYDLWALRLMIDSGSGYPPHWRGEPTDVNLATATAMERSATRHLRRRQLLLRWIVQDLAHLAYRRAYEIGKVRRKPAREAIDVETPDVNRQDNRDLSTAAHTMAQALQALQEALPGSSPSLVERIVRLFFRFADEPIDEEDLATIVRELKDQPKEAGPDA